MDGVTADPATDIPADPTGDITGDRIRAGEGRSPALALDGFSGPLDHLLALARAQQIDLARLSVEALVDQLAAALRLAGRKTPLGEMGDWVVMAAWLLLLRSRFLLPPDSPAQIAAEREARELQARLVALHDMQSCVGWLACQPQLGIDVFARGQPELLGVCVAAAPQVDVIEFLWAGLALFDDDPPDAAAAVYQPQWTNLYSVSEARARILQLLAVTPDGAALDRFLPQHAEAVAGTPHAALRRRAAWASTLIGGLELAKQGAVFMEQREDFQTIHIAPAIAHEAP
jgi:segregation and condensation protein A